MDMTASSASTVFHRLDPRPRTSATVATDGTAQSDGARRVVLPRANATPAAVEVVTVAAAEPVMEPEISFALWTSAPSPSARHRQRWKRCATTDASTSCA
jgi:hypothetical protein